MVVVVVTEEEEEDDDKKEEESRHYHNRLPFVTIMGLTAFPIEIDSSVNSSISVTEIVFRCFIGGKKMTYCQSVSQES